MLRRKPGHEMNTAFNELCPELIERVALEVELFTITHKPAAALKLATIPGAVHARDIPSEDICCLPEGWTVHDHETVYPWLLLHDSADPWLLPHDSAEKQHTTRLQLLGTHQRVGRFRLDCNRRCWSKECRSRDRTLTSE